MCLLIHLSWYVSSRGINFLFLTLFKLFYSFFKTLVGQPITVELKNDLSIKGTLVSVDQFLNIKIDDAKVTDEAKFPHMVRNTIQIPI